MQDFLKQFTLIDFLAMFIPGGCAVLILDYNDIWQLRTLCTSFFGENVLVLIFYFVIVSYLLGTLFSEFSKILEKFPVILGPSGSDYLRCPAGGGESEEHAHLRENLCGVDGKKRTKEEAFSFVKVSIYGVGSHQKRLLLSTFYEMARTFLVLIPVLAVLLLLYGKWTLPFIQRPLQLPLDLVNCTIPLIALILLYSRAKRFRALVINYTYTDYLLLQRQTNP